MNGRLDKVAMTNKLMQLKREIHYKCEIGEKNEGYCRGANDYLNRTFDVLDDCLLYTSPSPRDRQKSRMPSSA